MSTRTLVPACALIAALALPGAAAAKLPAFPSKVIEPAKSIGGVKLGATLKSAKAAWGTNKDCFFEKGNGTCSYQNGKQGNAQWSGVEGKVVDISISAGYNGTDPYFGGPLLTLKTSKGIGIGSSLKSAKQAYPGGKVYQGSVLSVPGKGKSFTTFSFVKGKCAAINIGDGKHQG
jgi:hypothetical protein